MRVALHVGQLFQPVPGGIGRYIDGLLGALPDVGIELTTFAAGGAPADREPPLPDYVDLGRPHAPWRYELWHRFRWPPVPVRAEVLHAPSLAVPPARGTPLVVTVHDLAFLRHPEVFTRRGVEFHRRGLSIAHREAAAVIAISEFTRHELIGSGFEPERVHVAPMAIVVPPAEPDALLDARIAAIGLEPPFVLSVGTIEPRKGLDTLTAAVANIRRTHSEVTLALAGPTGWLSVPGLDGQGVRRLGRVDEATLDALYRRADLCALPSRYEGFGLPALEAMARGCPVIASNTTALPEVVEDAGMLVSPGDVAAWTSALMDLLDDPEARDDLATRGRRRAGDFTWAASAQAHLDAYEAAGARRGSLVDSILVRLLLDVSAVPARPVGAGVYTVQLVRGLAEHDELDLHLLARRGDAARWSDFAPKAAIHAEVPERRPARLVWEQVRAPALADRLGIDVWHGPHYTMPVRLPVPAVVTVHDLTFFDHPEWHERRKVAIFTPMLRVSARRASALIAVSQHTADRLRAVLEPEVPVVIAPHGVDHERFRPGARGDAADLALLHGLGIRPPYLAFAATLEPRKDIPALIDAFARIAPGRPDLRLVIAGRDGWGATAVRDAAAASGVTTSILRSGWFPGAALPAFFRQAEAVAYPSLEEGFGLPALEALACGAALVTTTGSAMAEVVGDAALLVQPGATAALAATLARVLDDPVLATRLRQAGPVQAAPYTWAASVERHLAAYRLARGVTA